MGKGKYFQNFFPASSKIETGKISVHFGFSILQLLPDSIANIYDLKIGFVVVELVLTKETITVIMYNL